MVSKTYVSSIKKPAFSEPSEPSQHKPEDNPLTESQEENPQLIANKSTNNQDPPLSAFSEPSKPSQVKPADKPREQLVTSQEENPQVIAKLPKIRNKL